MKLNAVWPGLFLRGHSEQLPRDSKRLVLGEAGVARVYNLWSRSDPDLAGMYGRDYVHYPIPDGELKFSTAEILTSLARGAASVIRSGGTVLVQCHAGRNRSGLLAALIIRELTGWSGSKALAALREARPQAVANTAFVNFLYGLEAME